MHPNSLHPSHRHFLTHPKENINTLPNTFGMTKGKLARAPQFFLSEEGRNWHLCVRLRVAGLVV